MLSVRLVYPKFLVIFFVFFSCVPFRIVHVDYIFPSLDVMVIFYWCVFRPELMKNGFVFSMGILKDLLLASPVGISAVVNLIVRTLVLKKSAYVKSTFAKLWLLFAIILGVITIIKWLVFSFVENSWLDFELLFIQYILSVFFYPLIHRFLNMILLILPRSAVNE